MIRRGEIYCVSLDPAVGREQAGRRPVVVVSADWLNSRPLVVNVVPGSDGRNYSEDYPTNVRVDPVDSGLPRQTVFLALQIRAMDHSRFPDRPWGRLSAAKMEEIDAALRRTLALR